MSAAYTHQLALACCSGKTRENRDGERIREDEGWWKERSCTYGGASIQVQVKASGKNWMKNEENDGRQARM